MVKQYPHLLYGIPAAAADSSQDNSGNWTADTSASNKLSVCREVTDGKGRELQGADGKMHKYTSIIFTPRTCPDVPFGMVIYVRDTENSTADRIRGSVLKFDRGQLHCRIWV